MDVCSNKDEVCPQLLDLIPKDREWLVQRGEQRRNNGSSEEKKLELRLGPPGDQDWATKDGSKNSSREREFSLGYFSNTSSGAKRGFTDTVGMKTVENGWIMNNNNNNNNNNGSQNQKAFSPASANTAVPNSSQKRTAPAPVVGWPPIRSFRKNLASSSSSAKPVPESQPVVPNKVLISEKPAESCRKGFFVKINMDGVPIGRKVDLKAYDSYEKLSFAVDELFRGLLAAQNDSSGDGIKKIQEGEKVITGLLDGSGEYTLVYEDNEGDRMLVGDVPWHMFVSTVKRLRVLKSSELSTLRFGNKQEKIPT